MMRWISAWLLFGAAAAAQADDCPGLAGRFEILWPGEAPQPMRIVAEEQGNYRVEIELPTGRWVAQPARSYAALTRSERGILPRCAIDLTDYGVLTRSRALNWTGLTNPTASEWVIWQHSPTEPAGELLPVRRLGDL